MSLHCHNIQNKQEIPCDVPNDILNTLLKHNFNIKSETSSILFLCGTSGYYDFSKKIIENGYQTNKVGTRDTGNNDRNVLSRLSSYRPNVPKDELKEYDKYIEYLRKNINQAPYVPKDESKECNKHTEYLKKIIDGTSVFCMALIPPLAMISLLFLIQRQNK